LSFESISEKIGAKSFEVQNELVQFYLKDLEYKKGYKDWVEIQHKNELLVQEPAPIYSKTNNVGTNGNFWSSTVNGTNANNLNFNSSNANMNTNNRANGNTVRCLKDYLCLYHSHFFKK
jgi:hypothetical protein